ncbi:hypothetical protein [Kaarinaea lacus]
MNHVQYYAQRLLNPFRGMLQTITYASAEAVTTDGVHWDIYVRNDELVKDLENSNQVQTSDIRYGSWSEEKGLKRGPVFPSEDFKRLEEMGAVVYEVLLDVHKKVPFPLQDDYELWLLDSEGMPLALLDSAVYANDMDMYQNVAWRAGLMCRENFSSTILEDLKENKVTSDCVADYLTQYINTQAGETPCAQWFHRQDDGSGLGLQGINMATPIEGRRLLKEMFPGYLLRSNSHDDYHKILIEDFFKWQAPWLLLLPGLQNDERQALEQQARPQALIIDKQFRLYPDIIDEALIKAARVEAMLRKGQQQEPSEEDVMSTFYIELHPSPTE